MPMVSLNLRVPQEIIDLLDAEVERLQELTPHAKVTRSDAARYLLEQSLKKED